jgi:hypothetical protein
MLRPNLGITKEIMSRGPQVLDMECRELDDLSMALEGPSFLHVVPYHQQQYSSHRLGPEMAMSLAPRGNKSGYHGMYRSDF